MRFEIKHLFYLIALIGASIGLFGDLGIFVAAIVAWVWGLIFNDIRQEAIKRRAEKPKTDAAGFTLIELLVVICIITILVGLLFPKVHAPRSARHLYTVRHQLKGIAIALHSYHDLHGLLPPAIVFDEEGRAVHSWRTISSPYMESQPFFSKYDFAEPWNGTANSKLVESSAMPFVLRDDRVRDLETRYDLVVGPNAVWQSEGDQPSLKDVRQASTTIILLESEQPSTWTKPTFMSVQEAKRLLTSEPSSSSRWWHRGFFKSKWRGRPILTAGATVHLCGVLDEATAERLLTAHRGTPIEGLIAELPDSFGEAREEIHFHNFGRLLVFVMVVLWPLAWLPAWKAYWENLQGAADAGVAGR